jgi:hypothetical protein
MEALITTVIDGILLPILTVITGVIPVLASSGIMLAVFALAWLAFGVALARRPGRLDDAWRRIRSTPLVVQGLAWLLFLPVLAGLWAWRTSWPRAARLTIVVSLAAWNLLVLLPATV